MADDLPDYPVRYVPLSVVDKIAEILSIGQSYKEFAEIINRYSNGKLGFNTTRILAISNREGNPAEYILNYTMRTNMVTIRTWQRVLEDMNSFAADILPRHIREIERNFRLSLEISDNTGCQHACNCASCGPKQNSSSNMDETDTKSTGLPSYANCSCENCEKDRLRDPDETEVKRLIKNDTSGISSDMLCTCNDIHSGPGQNTASNDSGDSSEQCTCDTFDTFAVVHESNSTDDRQSQNNKHRNSSSVKQKRHSDPNDRVSECVVLYQRSSSDSDVSIDLKESLRNMSTETLDASARKRKLKIFVTYADDSRTHLQRVIEMCNSLKRNPNFEVKSDLDKQCFVDRMLNSHDWVQWQFCTSDFVILCISPAYAEYIKQLKDGELDNGVYPDETRLHVRYIFNLARSEFIHNYSLNRRFLPLLFTQSGTTLEHLPMFLRSTTWYFYKETFDILCTFLNDRYMEI